MDWVLINYNIRQLADQHILLLLAISFFAFNCKGQTEFQGDQVFQANKENEEFNFESNHAIVRIGKLVNNHSKQGVIFQHIDSVNNLWQLKLMTYENGTIIEDIIDTLDIYIHFGFEFIDKNFDSNKDLVITKRGNKTRDFLYLFDEEAKSLHLLKEFINYPNTKRTSNSNFLYSYKATGCADNYWESALIKIEGFELIEYGKILANNCRDSGNSMTVHIDGEKTTEIDMKVLDDFPGDKWEFIKEFWTQKVTSLEIFEQYSVPLKNERKVTFLDVNPEYFEDEVSGDTIIIQQLFYEGLDSKSIMFSEPPKGIKLSYEIDFIQYTIDDIPASPLEITFWTEPIPFVGSMLPDHYGNQPKAPLSINFIGFDSRKELETFYLDKYPGIKTESVEYQTDFYRSLLKSGQFVDCCPEYIEQAKQFLEKQTHDFKTLNDLALEVGFQTTLLELDFGTEIQFIKIKRN